MACNNQRGIVNISQLPMEVDTSNATSVLGLNQCGGILKIPIQLVGAQDSVQDLFWSIDTNSNLDLNVVLSNGVTKQISVPNVSTNSVGVIGKDMYNKILTNESNISTNTTNIATNTTNIATNTSNIAILQGDVATLQAIGGKWIGKTFSSNADLMAEPISSAWNNGDYAYVQTDETHNNLTTLYFWENGAWQFGLIIDTVDTTQTDKFTSNTIVGNVNIAASSDGSLSVNYTVWTFNTTTQTWSSSVYGWNLGFATTTKGGLIKGSEYAQMNSMNDVLTASGRVNTTATTATLNIDTNGIIADVPSDYDIALPIASDTQAGLMTATDKTKLDDISNLKLHNFQFNETTGVIQAWYNIQPDNFEVIGTNYSGSITVTNVISGTLQSAAYNGGWLCTWTPNNAIDVLENSWLILNN